MVDRRAKETPSTTKPLTTNGDARTVHPTNGTASYEKGYDRTHPHEKEGYSKVGSSAKTGKAEKPQRPGGEKADYAGKFDHNQDAKKGYDGVGSSARTGKAEITT